MFNADLVGQSGRARELSGPALILERSTLKQNISAMAERCANAGIKLRPHAKTHKSARIAGLQLAAGAVGICCATVHEVCTLARLGIKDILLTTPCAEPRKIVALVAAARLCSLSVVIDHISQIGLWEEALAAAGVTIDVLLDIDIGMGRTGLRCDEVLHTARRVNESKLLRYAGVQAYSGMVQHIELLIDRRGVYLSQMETLSMVLSALRGNGLSPATVSGGGTGTAHLDLQLKHFTELQAGSYAFMDLEYQRVQLTDEAVNPFIPALFVRSNVISANVPGQVTVNAGFKSLSTDGPVPTLRDANSPWKYNFFGDEYGRISGPVIGALRLGDPVDLLVPHCDPTVNLHDVYHILDEGTLTDIWTIDCRGSL